jgi:hypothetical protein
MTKELSTSDIAKLLGKKGGQSTVKKYGKDHLKRISKLGLEARRAKAKARKEKEN